MVNDYSQQLEIKSQELEQFQAKFADKKAKLHSIKKERNDLQSKL
jgi:hypothetical protein